MTEAYWIWIDLSELGLRWELAVKRDDETYFPWLDYSDHSDNFKKHQKIPIFTPPRLVTREHWGKNYEDHPCDDYHINKCTCGGGCTCHFDQADSQRRFLKKD